MSGVILVVLVVVWASVLVPMWVRRHDSVHEARSVDRFSTAMRILSRRTPAGRAQSEPADLVEAPVLATASAEDDEDDEGGRAGETVRPDASARLDRALVSLAERARGLGRAARTLPSAARPRDATPARGAVAVRRRRRVLLSLVVLTLLLTAAAGLGVLPRWPLVAAGLSVGGYVVHLRRQARRGASASPARGRLAAPTRHGSVGRPAVRAGDATTSVGRTGQRPAGRRSAARTGASPAATESSVRPSDAVRVIRRMAGEPPRVAAPVSRFVDVSPDGDLDAAAARDRSWSPVPVPLPTYVSAPVVRRPLLRFDDLDDLDDLDDMDDLDDRGDDLDGVDAPDFPDRSAVRDDELPERRRAVGN